MFSSEYRTLCCENASRLRGVWEPKFGDLILDMEAQLANKLAVVTASTFGAVLTVNWAESHYGWLRTKDELVPLFQPRQLIEMLEERGYEWMLWRRGQMKFYRCECKKVGVAVRRAEGPDPETALLKALLEMLP